MIGDRNVQQRAEQNCPERVIFSYISQSDGRISRTAECVALGGAGQSCGGDEGWYIIVRTFLPEIDIHQCL